MHTNVSDCHPRQPDPVILLNKVALCVLARATECLHCGLYSIDLPRTVLFWFAYSTVINADCMTELQYVG